jgi:hypothetical protein
MTQRQNMQTFKVGEIVPLCADPAATGAVIEVLPGAPEYRYRLFINLYYASQLQPLRRYTARILRKSNNFSLTPADVSPFSLNTHLPIPYVGLPTQN